MQACSETRTVELSNNVCFPVFSSQVKLFI